MLKRIGRHQKLITESGWVALGQIVAVIGSLLQVRVLTEYLDTTQYGHVTLALTAAVLVNQTVMGGLTNGIARFYAIADEKGQLSAYVGASALLMRRAAILVAGLGVFSVVVMAILGLGKWASLLATTLVFAIFSGYNAAIGSVQNAARQRRIVSVHLMADAWLKIAIAVGMIWLMGASGIAVLYGFTLAAVLVTTSQLMFFKRFLGRRLSDSSQEALAPRELWIGEIWKYSMPFHFFGLFTWAQQVSDRWALQTFSGPEDVGVYAVAYQLGYVPVALLTGMVVNLMSPILYGMAGAGDESSRNESVHRLAWRITVAGLVITLLGMALAYVLKDFLFGVLVAEKYHAAAQWLHWMVLAGGLFAAGQVLAVKLMTEMRPSALVVVKVVTALCGVGLNCALVYHFGAHGAVAGLVAFSAVYFLWMAMLAISPLDRLPKTDGI